MRGVLWYEGCLVVCGVFCGMRGVLWYEGCFAH